MARLEELTEGALVRGVLPDRPVRVIKVDWHRSIAVTLTYADPASGRTDQETLYRDDERRLVVEPPVRAWPMDADGADFRLAAEAYRISLAHLFDPYLAVETSAVQPLPHQVDAVYRRMLPQRTLRFLLADDPGAGKTITAGLLCKELVIRGDVERCLVVAPGGLVEQWQDELWDKLRLDFEILTRDTVDAARGGDPFPGRSMLIARLDQVARDERLQAALTAVEWDLVIVDEAHKMAAHQTGGEVRETRRYKLGRALRSVTRHLLLLTATPHSGVDEDFRLFLALLDPDRFAGRGRGAGLPADRSTLMRRLVKEDLLGFDGTPLFPERHAYTVLYPLSAEEARLYERVTGYVREEMDRADRLVAAGERARGAMIGFALTTLQRRLASSPEAIHRSLARRRARLERRLADQRRLRLGRTLTRNVIRTPDEPGTRELGSRFAEIGGGTDPDAVPAGELEELESELVERASAAATTAELDREIATLAELEALASRLCASGTDRKWEELSRLLTGAPQMFGPGGRRRKLIVFSEHRDTVAYLLRRLRALLGEAAVVSIHGGLGRDERRRVQRAFTADDRTLVLVATDAAGEGINLQRAHLVINYDLPWNPTRIEQRFGRVHRIGQTSTCHLWNLVAEDTREGRVFRRLFDKLEEQRSALPGGVFDVLGTAFHGTGLRDLLVEAVRHGERPEARDRLSRVVDDRIGAAVQQVLAEHALLGDVLPVRSVEGIRDDVRRAAVHRVVPHFLRDFFLAALARIGGTAREREPGRYEVTLPPGLRSQVAVPPGEAPGGVPESDRGAGTGRWWAGQVRRRYERVTFEAELTAVAGRPPAEHLLPGHPLLRAVVGEVLDRYGGTLRRGCVLVDDSGRLDGPVDLVHLQHTVVDGRRDRAGERRVVSRRVVCVSIAPGRPPRDTGWAPYLDLRPATKDELTALAAALTPPAGGASGAGGLAGAGVPGGPAGGDPEGAAVEYGIDLARAHLDEVRARTLARVERTEAAVRSRLEAEIADLDRQTRRLERRERVGELPASGMNSALARRRADDLRHRLARRLARLDEERQLATPPPVVAAVARVVPAHLLTRDGSRSAPGTASPAVSGTGRVGVARDAGAEVPWDGSSGEVRAAAVRAVLARERALGRRGEPVPEAPGYDVESRCPDGILLFLMVAAFVADAGPVVVTRREYVAAHNVPDHYLLAVVEDALSESPRVRYVRRPFEHVPDPGFAAATLWLDPSGYLHRAEDPR